MIAAASAAAVLIAILAAGYSRFNSKQDVLGSPRRVAILQAIKAEPGINVTRLAAQLGIERRAIRHHLSLLIHWEAIRIVRERQETKCYISGEAAPAPGGAEPAARAQVMALLSASPEGLTRKALHVALPGLPLRTRNHAIQQLIALGRIRYLLSQDGTASRLVLATSA